MIPMPEAPNAVAGVRDQELTVRDLARRVGARALGQWLIPFAVALLTFVVLSPALRNGFVEWDDQINLTNNEDYRGLGSAQLKYFFTTTLMGHYIPLTWLTFGLDYVLWGMTPLGYHLTSLIIFAANAAVLYLVALHLLAKAAALAGVPLRVAAVAATLFFALHPLRAESVAWATERRDVLSGLFFLLTILTYLRMVSRKKSPERTSRRSVAHATDSARSGWSAKKSVAATAATRSGTPASAAAFASR